MRILVIEDEERILSFVARGLAAAGYAVEAAENGRDGLERALHGTCDLVVLDLMLPVLGGMEVLQGVSANRPDLPVIILSARSDLETKLKGFELGAVDYVPKPFALDELLARVRAHLAHTHTHGDEVNVIRGTRVDLDVARRQAVVGEVRCDLGDREFHVLYQLLLREGEIVSRERLLSEVWGYSFDPGSNVVEVCIRRLRQRLGPNVAIETVRNAGYRLAA